MEGGPKRQLAGFVQQIYGFSVRCMSIGVGPGVFASKHLVWIGECFRSRVRKISNARIFEPILARNVTRHRLLDEILSFFGGRAQPMMAQLAEAGKLSLDDVREFEKTLKKIA